MKKKLIPLVLLGVLTIGGLVGCGGNDDPTTEPTTVVPTPTTPVDPTTPEPTTPEPTTPTPTTPAPTTPAVVHVESVDLSSEATTLYVGHTTNLTVTVLPENADDKTYTIESTGDAVSVEGLIVTAEEIGESVITVTTNDGAKTDSVTITVEEIPNPTITIAGETSLSVGAGSALTLPTVTATDYDGTDLTSYIEIEDLAESGTISGSTFNAKIAGAHEIVYYVETDDGRWAEEFLTVNVTPAHPEAFIVEGQNDPAAIATYGVYKENFEKGRKSPLYAALNDSNGASSLIATEDAIQGNSLLVNFNKTAGNATYSLFLSAFNDIFAREIAVTYKVAFDYKVVSDNVTNNPYFGLSWDGFDGLNVQFMSGKTKGETYHYEVSFPATKIPAAGNAYFFFFTLNASSEESLVAIDNFVFETVQCAQVTEVTPSAEQLQAEGGFRWDFAEKGASSSNGETVVIDSLEIADAKAAMKADKDFGANALKLTNSDGHLFSGLTKNNMLVGKKLVIEMKYYAVNGNGFHLIMMGENGNPTLEVSLSNEGNMYTARFEGVVEAGWYQLNIYGAGNPNFEIYIGYINASLKDADPIPVGQTPKGHKVGESYKQSSRQWGNEDKSGNNGTKTAAFDGNSDAIANSKMGSAPTKLTSTRGNATHEWHQASGSALPIEVEQTYEITVVYYVVECSARFMLNFDNAVFLDLDGTAGFHEHKITWTATKAVDFFSFFFPDEPSTATIYVAYTEVKLTKIAGAPDPETAKGHKAGDSWTNATRQWGPEDKGNGLKLEAYDGNQEAIANSKMGSAPQKLTCTSGNVTMEWYQPGGSQLENGHTYEITVVYYVVECNNRFMLNFDNSVFLDLDGSVGYHEHTIEWTATKSVDFFSFFFPDAGTTATVYIGYSQVTLKTVNL